jgi:hypothetical protein
MIVDGQMAFKWEGGSQCVGQVPLSWDEWDWGESDDTLVMVLDDRVMQERHYL